MNQSRSEFGSLKVILVSKGTIVMRCIIDLLQKIKHARLYYTDIYSYH